MHVKLTSTQYDIIEEIARENGILIMYRSHFFNVEGLYHVVQSNIEKHTLRIAEIGYYPTTLYSYLDFIKYIKRIIHE